MIFFVSAAASVGTEQMSTGHLVPLFFPLTDSEHTEIWLDYNQEYREKVQELLNITK